MYLSVHIIEGGNTAINTSVPINLMKKVAQSVCRVAEICTFTFSGGGQVLCRVATMVPLHGTPDCLL